MLQHTWSLQLSEEPLFAVVGQLPDQSIIFQGRSNQLSVFAGNSSSLLPIRRQLVGLSILPDLKTVLLLTPECLTAMDLLENSQLFSIDFTNAQQLYLYPHGIYVSCGVDLSHFTLSGQEQFVNHLRSPVTALDAVQSELGSIQIVIGLADRTMMRYKRMAETFDYGKVVGTPSCLVIVGDINVFLGTKEGKVAFYSARKPTWKHNSNIECCAAKTIPNTKSNICLLRSQGTAELWDWSVGTIVSTVSLNETVIGGVLSDYRKQGVVHLLCFLKSGIVKAVKVEDEKNVVSNTKLLGDEIKLANKKIDDFRKIKAELQHQLQQLTEQKERNQSDSSSSGGDLLTNQFKLKAFLRYEKGLALSCEVENGLIAGICFEQSIRPLAFERSPRIQYRFSKENLVTGEITCELMVQSSSSSDYSIIKTVSIVLPPFWKWEYLSEEPKSHIPEGRVVCKLVERPIRFLRWLSTSFILGLSEQSLTSMTTNQKLSLYFWNAYDSLMLSVTFDVQNCSLILSCNCLKTLGELIQDMSQHLNIKNLPSQLHFPTQIDRIRSLLDTIDELSRNKAAISTEVADSLNNIKTLLVQAESSRLIAYSDIMDQNRQMQIEVGRKGAQSSKLAESMKTLGSFINQTANVRVGSMKEKVVLQCRQAIKKREFPHILQIMQAGVE